MSTMKEELQDLSNELFKKTELRSHLDCLTKERILFVYDMKRKVQVIGD